MFLWYLSCLAQQQQRHQQRRKNETVRALYDTTATHNERGKAWHDIRTACPALLACLQKRPSKKRAHRRRTATIEKSCAFIHGRTSKAARTSVAGHRRADARICLSLKKKNMETTFGPERFRGVTDFEGRKKGASKAMTTTDRSPPASPIPTLARLRSHLKCDASKKRNVEEQAMYCGTSYYCTARPTVKNYPEPLFLLSLSRTRGAVVRAVFSIAPSQRAKRDGEEQTAATK